MFKTIWKYTIESDQQEINLPEGFKVLNFKENNIWVEVERTNPKTTIIIESFKLKIMAKQEIQLPKNSVIFSVTNQNEAPVIWFYYYKSEKLTSKRNFALVPTGSIVEFNERNYLGTIIFIKGSIVQHLYEIFEKDSKTSIETKENNSEALLIDRIKGAIYGHAIGDAIGLGTEFMSKEQIQYYYPGGYKNYEQTISDKHRSRWAKGEWTDDTDQMLCILESIISKKHVDEIDIAKRIHSWAFNGGRGIGNTVYNVITDLEFIFDPHKVSKKVWINSGRNMAANGAVMRTSILGIWDFIHPEKIKENSEKVAKITHYDPRCVGSSYIICYVISELLKGNRNVKELIKVSKQISETYDYRIDEYIDLSTNKKISKLKLDEKESIGYTLKAMAAGLWALQQSNYKQALLEIINEGGDADTNGAVAGAVLGAKLGYSGLPKEWIDGLLNKEKLDKIIDNFISLMKEKRQLD